MAFYTLFIVFYKTLAWLPIFSVTTDLFSCKRETYNFFTTFGGINSFNFDTTDKTKDNPDKVKNFDI